ncbi:MAG: hypothetical protein H8E17_10965 [Deltaproteobacteria bacterium]|nr:hypothetical protein [Deltaproteobacteria bacterium]
MKILYIPILFLFIVSCTGPETPSNTGSSRNGARGEIQGARDSRVAQTGPKDGTYIPGQILVKFKDNTLKEIINKIQKNHHLQTIRVVSPPNLYLMEITDGTSVERVIRELKKYDALEYAEPNYIRKIN